MKRSWLYYYNVKLQITGYTSPNVKIQLWFNSRRVDRGQDPEFHLTPSWDVALLSDNAGFYNLTLVVQTEALGSYFNQRYSAHQQARLDHMVYFHHESVACLHLRRMRCRMPRADSAANVHFFTTPAQPLKITRRILLPVYPYNRK